MKAAGWTDPAFFPIGVWYAGVVSQADVDLDKAVGLNTYVEQSDDADLSLIRRNGMHSFTEGGMPNYGSETVGWYLNDEVDAWAGPGDAQWSGNYPGQGSICIPADSQCGYTVLKTLGDRLPPNDGRPRYANFSFNVDFFQSDEKAARYLSYTDISSIDMYWYTAGLDNCEFARVPVDRCMVAASYGYHVDRMRELARLAGKVQPVYGFVEVGVPYDDEKVSITPDQMAGAVVNMLIHEARGILYFNHNFGGDCQTQNVLRSACGAKIRPMVTTVNTRIKELAPVLNTQSYEYTFNPKLETMLKEHDGSYYIFSMIGRGEKPGSYQLTLPPGLNGATVEVLYENRSLPINAGRQFTDNFAAEYSYHIYKITP